MADQQVKVVITGEDKSGPAFASAQGSTTKLSEGVSKLANVMGVGLLAAGAGAVAFLYSSAKAAGQAEAAMARVHTTVERTVDAMTELQYQKVQDEANKAFGGTGDVLDYLNGKINETSQKMIQLGFDDEDTAQSLSRLYQRTGDMAQAQTLLITATDLARAKNIELSDATNLVGQVLSGNGRVLKQYGIELSDSLTPLQALGELQKQVGGQADAFSHTFEGQMQVLDVQFTNLKETVGAVLLEAIMPFVKELSAWAADPAVQNQIKSIVTGLGNFAKVTIPIVITGVKFLYDTFMFFYNLLVDLEVKIFKVIDALTAMYNKAVAAAQAVASTVKSGPGGIATGAVSELKYLVSGKASGGPVQMGNPYIVGENGPEMFVPNTSGTIIPNGGGGGTVVNIHNPILLDDSMVSKLSQMIARSLGNNLRY